VRQLARVNFGFASVITRSDVHAAVQHATATAPEIKSVRLLMTTLRAIKKNDKATRIRASRKLTHDTTLR
jgi:hypothetical protein